MTLSTQPIKGARDFYPEDMRLQKYIFGVWREVCERYGYEEYDAPVVEPTDLYLSKGNEEIITEQTYSFTDRGGRNLTLRTEMTPTVSRMVAGKRQELAYPLRWYSIPQCWRYERMQRGRGREFYQLNVDIFGVESLAAEAEMIQSANAILRRFGAKPGMYEFKVNSRLLVNFLLQTTLGLNETQMSTMIGLIDRRAKMPAGEFTALIDGLLSPGQRESNASEQLFAFLDSKDLDSLPVSLKLQPAVQKLTDLLAELEAYGITNVTFDPSLMRGFDYYTDVVFEVFDTHPDNNRSMFGGGRYDGLVAEFGVEPVPTAGYAMGDITLKNFLEEHELLPVLKPETDVYVVTIGDALAGATKIAGELRSMGLNIALDPTKRKADKQIKAAVKKGIRYALFVGEKELESEQYILKDLNSGQEEAHSVERIVSTVKDFRKA